MTESGLREYVSRSTTRTPCSHCHASARFRLSRCQPRPLHRGGRGRARFSRPIPAASGGIRVRGVHGRDRRRDPRSEHLRHRDGVRRTLAIRRPAGGGAHAPAAAAWAGDRPGARRRIDSPAHRAWRPGCAPRVSRWRRGGTAGAARGRRGRADALGGARTAGDRPPAFRRDCPPLDLDDRGHHGLSKRRGTITVSPPGSPSGGTGLH